MTENRYSKYLPQQEQEWREFQQLAKVEGQMLEEEAEAKLELEENQWLLSARRSGLLRTAGIMGFLGAERLETESLRKELLTRWNNQSPYTYFHLLDWLDGCLGTESYTLHLEQEQYTLRLLLELWVKEKKDFLQSHLRKILPANLLLEVRLKTNTYGDVGRLTHGALQKKGLTYGQIPTEDLRGAETGEKTVAQQGRM